MDSLFPYFYHKSTGATLLDW